MDSDQIKLGLLSNKDKYSKTPSSSNKVEDIEMQDVDGQAYLSFDDAQEKVKFQKSSKQAPKPSNHDSDILFNLDDGAPQSIIQQVQLRPDPLNRQVSMPSAPNNHQNSNQGLYRQQTQNQQYQQQSSHVVICTYCSAQQQVRDYQSQFQCFKCRNVVLPYFNQFQCGCCFTYVTYQVGISQIVRCSRCTTVNYLPNQQYNNNNFQQQQMQQPQGNQMQFSQPQMQPQLRQPQMQQQTQVQQNPALRPSPVDDIILQGDSDFVAMNTTAKNQTYQQQNKEL